METNSNRVTTPILPRVDTTCEKTENVLVSPISKKSSDDKVAGKFDTISLWNQIHSK